MRLALVHLGTDEQARELFAKYKLDDVARFSDPDKNIYREFELKRGNPISLILHPKIWWRGLKAIFAGYGAGKPVGDPWQMPGAVLLEQGQVVRSYNYKTVADLPNFQELYASK